MNSIDKDNIINHQTNHTQYNRLYNWLGYYMNRIAARGQKPRGETICCQFSMSMTEYTETKTLHTSEVFSAECIFDRRIF